MKVSGVRKVHVRTGQVRIGQVRTGQVKTAQVRTGSVRTGQVRISQVRTGQVRKGEVRTDLDGLVPYRRAAIQSTDGLLHFRLEMTFLKKHLKSMLSFDFI